MASIINASSSGSGGIVQTADASGVLQLQSNGTTALTVSGATVTLAGATTLSNTLQVATTIGVGGATPAASGAGITFPATQSLSSNANTLDDYEEGTFTATLTGSTTNPTVTYDQQLGYYTKVGNVVNALIYIQTSARTGGSGNLQITGLPFAQSATANRMGGNVLLYAVNAGIGAASVWPNGVSGNTFFTLLASNNNGSVWSDTQVSGVPNSLAAIKVQITYLVDY